MNPLKKIIGQRRQLFEIQDFPWCPHAIRDGVTDYLAFSLKLVPLYAPSVPWLKKMHEKNSQGWIDLCAGAGGGSLPLHHHLPGVPLHLTDLYPQDAAIRQPLASVYPDPVDASNVPDELKGFRTLYTSLHHLPDPIAKLIFKDAFLKKQPIGAFEFTERNLFCLLMTAPTLIFSFIMMPFIWPWKASRFFWTYILPLIPIVATFDILASCLRTRSTRELEILIQDLKHPDYQWHIGQEPSSFGFSMTYIVGLPKDKS